MHAAAAEEEAVGVVESAVVAEHAAVESDSIDVVKYDPPDLAAAVQQAAVGCEKPELLLILLELFLGNLKALLLLDVGGNTVVYAGLLLHLLHQLSLEVRLIKLGRRSLATLVTQSFTDFICRDGNSFESIFLLHPMDYFLHPCS